MISKQYSHFKDTDNGNDDVMVAMVIFLLLISFSPPSLSAYNQYKMLSPEKPVY